ncbi:MAG TPA: cellulase family glycosylhydrolase [Anaerolineae bacterium]|nr:cellulase family glycosylhydrolase [Anaerolineae bacterium]
MIQHRILLCVFTLILLWALPSCNLPILQQDLPVSPTPTLIRRSQPQSTAAPLTSSQPSQTIQHRIGIRVIDGIGEFYDRVTGEKFTPRGMNYIRLAWQAKADGSKVFGHSLFDPDHYDHRRVNSDLEKMHADAYNVVRVFLSPDTMSADTGGLSPDYMVNIADFLKLAKANQIYVMFTLDWIPGGRYGEILNQDCCSTFALMNANFLPPAGLRANQVFYQDFIRELIKRDAPIEYVLSYELRNEMFYDGDQPPLSMNSGTVVTANGKSYDLSNPADKQRMLDENLVFWIDAMRTSILQVDPTALVSVGFFQPQFPNRSRIGDPRIAVTEPAIWQSHADFIDLHAYPGFELNLRQYMENFGLREMQAKPIIMGEFGSEVKRFASIDMAARRFVDWQVESCKYGFDGWIFWTWDLTEQPDFFNALMDKGQIGKALAPLTRPDPCSP